MEEKHYEFGAFRLFPSEHLLLRENDPVPLAPKAFEILETLVASHGHLLTRERLMQTVWPDSFVEETNLTVNISLLRKALGEMPDGRPWIATVPKRGYRFDGPVRLHTENRSGGAETSEIEELKAQDPIVAVPPPVSSPITGDANDAEVLVPVVTGARGIWPPQVAWYKYATALALLAGGILLVFWLNGRLHPQPALSIHSLAILPLNPASTNAEDQYLGVGLTDALITRLGGLSQIIVRPIGAVRTVDRDADPVAIGRQLNVQAVLDGSVERVGDHIRVAVHLQRVDDGSVLWSDSFDGQNSSDFAIEDSISERLAKALTLRLSREEKRRLITPNTPNSQAYELYIQGRYYWNKRTVDSVQKSIDLFRQATMLDPNYAAAWSGLADSWILAGSYGNSFVAPSVAMPKAKEAAEKALALDDSSAEAHTSLAYIHFMWDWDYSAAEQQFKRAIQVNPGYVNAHHWYSHELMALGRIAESHEESETALGLDPTDVVINEHMAWHHLMAREYARSLPQANKAVELDPSFVQAHRVLALDLLYTGRVREACGEFEKGVELAHGDPVARAYLARCYALDHRKSEARKILGDLEQASSERYVSAAEIAAVYAALADPESTLKWLERACNERASSLVYLNVDPVWDQLRSNPGFQHVLARVSLPIRADETSPH